MAAAEGTGSSMKRYEEMLERFEKCGDGDEEGWGAILRLHGGALEGVEKWFLN